MADRPAGPAHPRTRARHRHLATDHPWAYQLIRGLVSEGRNPDPVVALAAARQQPSRDALDPDAPPTPTRHHQLAVYLFSAYSQTVTPAAAPTYAREVLDDAYRRAFSTNGIRMQQLGECDADRGSHRAVRRHPRRTSGPVAALRSCRPARVVAAMMRTDPLEAAVAGHTARHLAATTYSRPGRSRHDAAALIESLHSRAQRRAERRHRTEPANVGAGPDNSRTLIPEATHP